MKEKPKKHPNHPPPPPPRRIYEDVDPTLPVIICLAVVIVVSLAGVIYFLPPTQPIPCGC